MELSFSHRIELDIFLVEIVVTAKLTLSKTLQKLLYGILVNVCLKYTKADIGIVNLPLTRPTKMLALWNVSDQLQRRIFARQRDHA